MALSQRIYITGFLVLILMICPILSWAGFVTKLSNTHIQSALQLHFPLREYAAFARVTLHEPQVLMTRNAADIVLIVPVDANIPDQPLRQGHATVAVSISYKPATGGLYLSNPRLAKLEMPEISKSLAEDLRIKVDTIFKNSLPLVRIYKVMERDLNHSLAKSVMKSFTIGDEKLELEFGFE